MTPEDDMMWPTCHEHPAEKHWCPWIQQFLLASADSSAIENGMNYCVPIFPNDDLYVEVSIDSDLIMGMCAKLYLVGHTVPFDPNPGELIQIGLWNEGEGRFVISQTISQWTAANATENCHANAHGFSEEMQFQKQINDNPAARKIHDWCLAYYKMCFVCRTKAITPAPGVPASAGTHAGGGSGQSIQFDAASFGLGTGNFTPARNQGNASDGQAARTRNLLQQRNPRYK